MNHSDSSKRAAILHVSVSPSKLPSVCPGNKVKIEVSCHRVQPCFTKHPLNCRTPCFLHHVLDKNVLVLWKSLHVFSTLNLFYNRSSSSNENICTVGINKSVVLSSALQSLNGVYVNGSRIQPSLRHVIEPGDRIAFGVGIDPNPPEFEYVFEHAGRGKKRSHAETSSTNRVKQRKILSESVNVSVTADHPVVREAIGVAEEKIKRLKSSLEDKEKCHADVVQQLEKTEKDMQAKLLEQKAALENEKQELESALKTLFAEKLTEKEEELNEQLRKQKESLMVEKELVEAQLQEELNRKLEEKDKELENQLTQQKLSLEKVISEKEAQQNLLHTELENYKASQARLLDLEANEIRMESTLQELRQIVESKNEELLKQQEETKRVEMETRKTVIEQMEDEFTCIICQDLFINSTTLPCAHSFCEYCLQTWLLKKNNCPICRQTITGKPVRSLVLDNAIAKMVESMDEETKTRRQTVSQERQELKLQGNTVTVVIIDG